ncbi:MAG: hypothetical protein LPK03_09260, partial [Pontibacter sp.]|nr:hypothetical protein [Pontibacter sp.]
LYASDSEQYRLWVTAQILSGLLCIYCLLGILRRRVLAVLCLGLFSASYVYISAIYTNYSHETEHVYGFLYFWLVYGIFLIGGWAFSPPNKKRHSDASGADASKR